jgi:hypothetical protein
MHIRQTRPPWYRHTLWAVVLLGALAATAVYFVLHPEQLPEWAARTELGRDLQTTAVYRWRDADGRWHVSDRPPRQDVEYEVERYSRDDNVLPLPPGLKR